MWQKFLAWIAPSLAQQSEAAAYQAVMQGTANGIVRAGRDLAVMLGVDAPKLELVMVGDSAQPVGAVTDPEDDTEDEDDGNKGGEGGGAGARKPRGKKVAGGK